MMRTHNHRIDSPTFPNSKPLRYNELGDEIVVMQLVSGPAIPISRAASASTAPSLSAAPN